MSVKNGDLPAMPISYDARMMAAYSKGEAMGLTKREQFAMAAMQGLASSAAECSRFHEMATDAVAIADALLAELERTK